jgi:Lon protease-like protein
MLPLEIPLFPLPNVVLFPAAFLPLHIFEHRYRAMVADALTSERLIGIVLLRPGWESDYEGRPAVYPIGCAGFITHDEPLEDGRYNIVLRGLEKFKILSELPSAGSNRPYRVAQVETIPETAPATDRDALRDQRLRLEKLIARRLQRPTDDSTIPPDMRDEDLVSALAQHLALDPIEKQALLERDGLLARCRSLVELIEMQMLVTHVTITKIRH